MEGTAHWEARERREGRTVAEGLREARRGSEEEGARERAKGEDGARGRREV